MLLIYLLEGNPTYTKRIQHLLQRSYVRQDSIYTSSLLWAKC
jgi:hypothetical protein